MTHRPPDRRRQPAMTLMDSVLAIAVIAATLPLLLATAAASLEARRAAEAETRAAWLAGVLSDEIRGRWAKPPRPGQLPIQFDAEFPVIASAADPWLFLFDAHGKFVGTATSGELTRGSRQARAAFLVRLHAEATQPANLTTASPQLSHLVIQIEHPAAAPSAKRQRHAFAAVLAGDPPL